MPTIDQAVKREWDDEAQDDDEVDPESVAVGIKTWLLLTGVLETLMASSSSSISSSPTLFTSL